uniref:Uncharacterized protein n=1 Tax=Setaria viridis TaxID=4556 RepID=A0A4U6U248_SETVI|nr:hypothetical protein SEVIR_6G109600v2 [Setaria viridis]
MARLRGGIAAGKQCLGPGGAHHRRCDEEGTVQQRAARQPEDVPRGLPWGDLPSEGGRSGGGKTDAGARGDAVAARNRVVTDRR